MPRQAASAHASVSALSVPPHSSPKSGTMSTFRLVRKALRLDEMYCNP